MPFYEYECQDCKFYTEVMQKITDAPLTKCPSCGKNALKKLLSAPVFRLKGGGWYETDFKSDQEGKRNLAGAEKEEATTAAKAETGDSKEATAPAKEPAAAAAKEAKPSSAASSAGSANHSRASAAGGRLAAKPVAKPASVTARAKSVSKSASKPKAKRRPKSSSRRGSSRRGRR